MTVTQHQINIIPAVLADVVKVRGIKVTPETVRQNAVEIMSAASQHGFSRSQILAKMEKVVKGWEG